MSTIDDMLDIKKVSTRTHRAAEEYMTLKSTFGEDRRDIVNGGTLTFLIAHLATLVGNATDGRYQLVLRNDDGEDVPFIAIQRDESIQWFEVDNS